MRKIRSPRPCPLCGGEKESGHTTYTVDYGAGVIVVRGVPATICSQCGEEWIDAKTARQLEQSVSEAKKKKPQLEVIGL
ncbi:MAG: type II toxin-antitoxin system MqsA family antitoxin [Nitrospirae bacterium]|nr:type II toxin-antitoxin system MqsA family antitoxin [Nitrospirota bacterium]